MSQSSPTSIMCPSKILKFCFAGIAKQRTPECMLWLWDADKASKHLHQQRARTLSTESLNRNVWQHNVWPDCVKWQQWSLCSPQIPWQIGAHTIWACWIAMLTQKTWTAQLWSCCQHQTQHPYQRWAHWTDTPVALTFTDQWSCSAVLARSQLYTVTQLVPPAGSFPHLWPWKRKEWHLCLSKKWCSCGVLGLWRPPRASCNLALAAAWDPSTFSQTNERLDNTLGNFGTSRAAAFPQPPWSLAGALSTLAALYLKEFQDAPNERSAFENRRSLTWQAIGYNPEGRTYYEQCGRGYHAFENEG